MERYTPEADLISLSIEYAGHLILSYGPFGPLVVIGLYVLHSFIPFPAQVITFTVGAVYGAVWGTILVWAGVLAGALATFGAARLGGRRAAQRFVAPERLEKLDAWVAQRGVGALLLGRLIPFVPFTLMNYAAGLAHVSCGSNSSVISSSTSAYLCVHTKICFHSTQPAGADWFLAATRPSTPNHNTERLPGR